MGTEKTDTNKNILGGDYTIQKYKELIPNEEVSKLIKENITDTKWQQCRKNTSAPSFTTCLRKCTEPCSHVSYNLQSRLEPGSQNSTVVSIYFEKNTVTKIKQVPKTNLVQLLSNTGGSLGLFLGCSILSLLELC